MLFRSKELRLMLRHAVFSSKGPVAIRYPRGAERLAPGCESVPPLSLDRAQVLRTGKHVTIASCGVMALNAILAADILAKEGILCEVIDIRHVKPLDITTLLESCRRTGKLVTLEDGAIVGGFGTSLCCRLVDLIPGLGFRMIGTGDHPVVQGSISRIFTREGMDPDAIANTCRELALKTE